jgi:hypothetical protein
MSVFKRPTETQRLVRSPGDLSLLCTGRSDVSFAWFSCDKVVL